MAKFLTDNERSTIIDKIMDDMPKRDPAEVCLEFQHKLYEAMPPEVRTVYEKYPQALNTEYDYGINGVHEVFITGSFKRHGCPTYAALAQPYYEEQEKLRDTRSKLLEAFKTVRTLASLHESFPDFKKYFPPINALDSAKRKKKDDLTAEELQALLDAKRKEEEKKALKTVKSFGIANELAQMGWTPEN